MDYFLIGTGIILLFVGIVGCVVPALPGPPISYVALLLLHFSDRYQFSSKFLLTWLAVTIVVSVIDYVVPIWGAKKFGASKAGIYGSIAGLFAGLLIFPPIGIIIGPFAGAVAGEIISGKTSGQALKSGFGSFAGFIGGTLLKLITSGMMTWYFFKTIVGY